MELNCCDKSVDWYFDNGKLYSERNKNVVELSFHRITAFKWKLQDAPFLFRTSFRADLAGVKARVWGYWATLLSSNRGHFPRQRVQTLFIISSGCPYFFDANLRYTYSKIKIVYLQRGNCDSGQKKEIESKSALSQSSGRHFVEEPDRLHSVQTDKNSEVLQPPKLGFHHRRETEAAKVSQQSSCLARVCCDLREIWI